ncbi:MAG: cysteine desulfurase [Acidocella sp. 20-57-95]|nr:MAG: cysteine desulfurase [Acidocella sp. 20-57-95]OYV58484.1 MAG: cysteine desulfurase [Acidocella sp. 21-58-7]HQT64744.1 aminotransferase class V-fold PLP-dependent enzyme [Acidocella sp.]HQU04936.1 aminotransferase class V-fold PLP-dependent enzyme [Acidocella sp.]
MVYLDANASEPLRPEAREAALAAMVATGNPASVHQAGREVRRILESAREALATQFAARAQDVVFTSGATEANALAIHALSAGRTVLVGATEHDAVRAAAPNAITIPVLPDGLIDPQVLDDLLTQHPHALVCLMAANNETGVLHDITRAARVCNAHKALLHVDAAQAAVRARQDWLRLGASSIVVSAHKAGGLLGAGAVIFAPPFGEQVAPIIKGGGQERGWRGGTPAIPAIASMAAAFSVPYDAAKITGYRDDIEAFCVGLGAHVAGQGAPRLPNTLNIALPGVRADTQLISLDSAGIAVSAGSACSSGKIAASHVLLAMGFGELAAQAVRVSLPWNVSGSDIVAFKQAYETMAKRALHRGTVTLTQAQFAN